MFSGGFKVFESLQKAPLGGSRQVLLIFFSALINYIKKQRKEEKQPKHGSHSHLLREIQVEHYLLWFKCRCFVRTVLVFDRVTWLPSIRTTSISLYMDDSDIIVKQHETTVLSGRIIVYIQIWLHAFPWRFRAIWYIFANPTSQLPRHRDQSSDQAGRRHIKPESLETKNFGRHAWPGVGSKDRRWTGPNSPTNRLSNIASICKQKNQQGKQIKCMIKVTKAWHQQAKGNLCLGLPTPSCQRGSWQESEAPICCWPSEHTASDMVVWC